MPAVHPDRQPPAWRLSAFAARVGVVLGLAAGAICVVANAQAPAPQASAPRVPASQPAASPASAVLKPASRAPGASVAKTVKPPSTRPAWHELTEAQRQALAPLAGTWDKVSEAQKRKWIALSQNYPRLSAPEQAKLHSRMTEWVALSPQQRTQARLNFGKTLEIPADDKKAKWEAYQALPPEEKKKLAAGASKPPPAAVAIKPVPSDKLARVPQPNPAIRPPRIAAGADKVDQNTLLPQPGTNATN